MHGLCFLLGLPERVALGLMSQSWHRWWQGVKPVECDGGHIARGGCIGGARIGGRENGEVTGYFTR